jgi:hypothetical protein
VNNVETTPNGRPEQVTGYPMVCLVDVNGDRVGVGEKDIPDVHREPCPADTWPAWTDIIRVHVGRRDFGVIMGSWDLVDRFREVVRRAEIPDDPADFDDAMDRLDDEQLLPDPEPEPYRPTDLDWQDYRAHFDREDVLYGYE